VVHNRVSYMAGMGPDNTFEALEEDNILEDNNHRSHHRHHRRCYRRMNHHRNLNLHTC